MLGNGLSSRPTMSPPPSRTRSARRSTTKARTAGSRGATGFGIRLDAGTAYTGAIITRSYDSLLVKVTAWAPTPEEASARMHRALWEFRIRGVVTNLRFLDQVITHPAFASGEYTTRFVDTDEAGKILDLLEVKSAQLAAFHPVCCK